MMRKGSTATGSITITTLLRHCSTPNPIARTGPLLSQVGCSRSTACDLVLASSHTIWVYGSRLRVFEFAWLPGRSADRRNDGGCPTMCNANWRKPSVAALCGTRRHWKHRLRLASGEIGFSRMKMSCVSRSSQRSTRQMSWCSREVTGGKPASPYVDASDRQCRRLDR